LKRTAAILLCALLLFNWAGYRVLLSCLQDRANGQLEAMLDSRQYDESQLLSMKIPAPHLSSYSISGQFERISGQVIINGIQYQYVKKRFYNDSLEFVCMPNAASTLLLAARNDFFKQVNDLQHNGQQKKAASYSGPSNEFSTGAYIVGNLFNMPDPGSAVLKSSCRYFVLLPYGFSPVAEQPPEMFS
jgi:hypothetical protein